MKHTPPRTAPTGPRSRQAQKMASCVEAGPGRRLVVAMPSSNSLASIHPRSSTHIRRSRAMWVGGPPNPIQPRRVHSRAMVPSDTLLAGSGSTECSSLLTGFRRRGPHRPTRVAGAWSLPASGDPWPSPRRRAVCGRRRPGTRADQPLGFHLVQGRVEGSGADPVAVAGQLLRHPRPVDLAVGGVMEDVQSHGAPEELSHGSTLLISNFDIHACYQCRG